jgi:hypothetical protein
VRTMRRCDHVARLERGADAGRDGLLADGDVQEPRQLACTEAFLDLLLEPADHEHLPEELPQPLLAEARGLALFPLYLRHGRHYADRSMKLVDQWSGIHARLPSDWVEVGLTLETEEPRDLVKAAAVLGPLTPIRSEGTLVFYVTRAGGAGGPEAARRLFARLDEQRVWCTLKRGEIREGAPVETAARVSVAQSWRDALGTLPEDWSELLCRLEISGSALLPRAALLCAPINPTRDRDSIGFLFRASRIGYGVSAQMAERCFERLDEEEIAGSVTVLRALSDTRPIASQGSSWIVAGRVL